LRRNFLKGAVATGVASAGLSLFAARPAAADDPPMDSGRPGRRYVIRGGSVMSLDPQVGDFTQADVLVEGKKLLAVGPNLAAGGAAVIDASGRIVMPGFIDTHHHQFETVLRSCRKSHGRYSAKPRSAGPASRPSATTCTSTLPSVTNTRAPPGRPGKLTAIAQACPGMTCRAVKNQPLSFRELWAALRLTRKTVEDMGRPRGARHPNHLAKRIADIATDEVEDVVRCVKKESR
jgi:hypothetical protein